jgi:hypothetical protein
MPKSALYTDSGERTFHTPDDIQQNSGRNTVQLLAREAFDNTGIMHYYFMYTDNSGHQSYVSAFPENGKIIMENGAYTAGSPDFRRSIRVGEITGSPEEVAKAFNNIKGEFRRMHKNYDYLPWQNSNSAAVTALFNSGIHFKRGTPRPGDFSNVNAPGQSTYLSPKSLNKDNINGKEEKYRSSAIDSNSNYDLANVAPLNTFMSEKTIAEKRANAITEKPENAGISNSAAEFDSAFIGVVMNLKNLTPDDKQDILKEQGIDGNKIQINHNELVPG